MCRSLTLRFDPSRRRFLAMGAAAMAAGACGFPPESGAAFAPWDFPDEGLEPRLSLVHAATLAASPHNTQPWWFTVEASAIELSLDPDQSLGAMDPLGREQRIGIGCALENLVLAAPRFGFAAAVTYAPRPDVLARVELSTPGGELSPLFDQIAHRRTNRSVYADLALPTEVPELMRGLIEDLAPVQLHLLDSSAAMEAFRDGTNAATKSIVADDEMWDWSHRWWRQTEEQIEAHRDGLNMDLLGVGDGTRVLGKTQSSVSAKRAGDYWIRNTKKRQLSASAFGILGTPELEDPASLLQVGRAWQRLHLWLSDQGAAAQPLNQMAERRDREVQLGLERDFEGRLARLADGHAQMLFRVGYAWDDAFASPRRPVDWVSEEV